MNNAAAYTPDHNRTRYFGKAVELEGLDRLQNVLAFKKIEGPNVPR